MNNRNNLNSSNYLKKKKKMNTFQTKEHDGVVVVVWWGGVGVIYMHQQNFKWRIHKFTHAQTHTHTYVHTHTHTHTHAHTHTCVCAHRPTHLFILFIPSSKIFKQLLYSIYFLICSFWHFADIQCTTNFFLLIIRCQKWTAPCKVRKVLLKLIKWN